MRLLHEKAANSAAALLHLYTAVITGSREVIGDNAVISQAVPMFRITDHESLITESGNVPIQIPNTRPVPLVFRSRR
jgi:hypothetical protein